MTASPDLLAYTHRFEYEPGDLVSVSAAAEPALTSVDLDLVRLRSWDDRVVPARPRDELVGDVPSQSVSVHAHRVHRGSFGVVDGITELRDANGAVLDVWVFPTLVNDELQTFMAGVDADGRRRFAIAVKDSYLVVAFGSSELESGLELPSRWWTRVRCTFDGREGTVEAAVASSSRLVGDRQAWHVDGSDVRAAVGSATALLIGAGAIERTSLATAASDCFTGKLDNPVLARLHGSGAETLVDLDLAIGIDSTRLFDASGRGHHGRLENAPTRGVTGRAWNATEYDFRLVPHQYSAVHFHADDLEDVRWPELTSIALPADLASGVYAVRLRHGSGAQDHVPFFVLPSPRAEARNRLALLFSTWTYQAYANGKLYESATSYADSGLTDRVARLGPRDHQMARNAAFSGSLYDVHSDGSGRSWSTARRPILNMRADYTNPVQAAPRHFSADLYLSTWLEREGYRFDVLTDGAVHAHGVKALSGYAVVMTSSHPEYVSREILDALEAYQRRGGSMMYLGGNGFHAVMTQDRERPYLTQVRRGNAGTRPWESEPGEARHSTTGETGGTWRHRGRPANRLVGVGMAAQGWDDASPGYRRTETSFAPRTAWIFDGVDGDTFGEDGLVLGGAAGDELDRYDEALGSPRDAVVVATSLGHSHHYKPVLEDVMLLVDGLSGDTNPDVRSDVVYYTTSSGAQVFAVGSIAWAGAMAYNDYENDVARITRNVLSRFMEAPSG